MRKFTTQIEFLIIITAIITLYTFYIRMQLLPDVMSHVVMSTPYKYVSFDAILNIDKNFRLYSSLLIGFTIIRLLSTGYRCIETMRITQFIYKHLFINHISFIITGIIILLMSEMIVHFVYGPFYSMFQHNEILPLLGHTFLFIFGIGHEDVRYNQLFKMHMVSMSTFVMVLLIVCIKFILFSLCVCVMVRMLIRMHYRYHSRIKQNKHLCNIFTFIRERLFRDKRYSWRLRAKTINYALAQNEQLELADEYKKLYRKFVDGLFDHKKKTETDPAKRFRWELFGDEDNS